MTVDVESFMAAYDFTEDQREAFSTLVSGSNVFLTGEAGTGKSYVLNAFLDWCEAEHKSVLPMAPTGIAALNLRGGSTIHRSLAIKAGFLDPSDAPQMPRKVLRNADVVIIDEISMCRIDLFEYVVSMILAAQRVSGPKQVVLVGDFFQLPPVVTQDDQPFLARLYGDDWKAGGYQNWDGFCFASQYWRGLALVPCILHEIVRQKDADFQNALNELRRGDASCIPFFNRLSISKREAADPDAIWLCTKNASADKINEERLSEIDAPAVRFKAAIEGKVSKADKAAPDLVTLKNGARVMSLANGEKYRNGSLGTVVECDRDDEGVDVLFDDCDEVVTVKFKRWSILKAEGAVKTEVDPATGDSREKRYVKNVEVGAFTQMPLRLAYAVTIHKSQGQTFDAVTAETHAFAPGQLYVALSRCTTAEGLKVYPKVEPRYIRANPLVVDFYDSLEREIAERKSSDGAESSKPPKPTEQSARAAHVAAILAAAVRTMHSDVRIVETTYEDSDSPLPSAIVVENGAGTENGIYARSDAPATVGVPMPSGTVFSTAERLVKRICPVCGCETISRIDAIEPSYCPSCGTRFVPSKPSD